MDTGTLYKLAMQASTADKAIALTKLAEHAHTQEVLSRYQP